VPPAPRPDALRRDRPSDAPWITLTPRPADAPTPDFPLTDPTDRELELWATEWKRPQAAQWLANDEVQGVALFVRLLALAEKPTSPVTVHKYLREYRNELGISADGAARRRWHLPGAAQAGRPASVTPIRTAPADRPRPRSTAKGRFNVIPAQETPA
jgi:hypothetical protein